VATTKIWDIKGWIGKVVIYVENPEKTENPGSLTNEHMTDLQLQHMEDVMEYAMTDERAAGLNHVIEYATDGHKTEKQFFVSALNCSPETARQEMMLTKKQYEKMDGITAFHGYQSFKPGEVTPDTAHEIGVKLAQELWGERFEVVIATHLDKSHVHNHFVLNSVSFADGYKYYDNKENYAKMRAASDRLCREYALSVIKDPKPGKSRHYAEWKSERQGKPTWRSLIKTNIDTAVAESMTERQFFDNLKKQGYEIKNQKYLSVRPPGKERFFRLDRNFGEDYSLAGIRKRILAQTRPQRPAPEPVRQVKHYRLVGSLKTARKITGFRTLYFHYLYLLGKLPKNRPKQPSPKQVYFLYREDLAKLDKFTKEVTLLCRNRIDTSGQLSSYQGTLTAEIGKLTDDRKHLRYKSRSIKDEKKLAAVKTEISGISKRLSELRKEVGLCDDIFVRTEEMKAKMQKQRQEQNAAGKEKKPYEPIRGRS